MRSALWGCLLLAGCAGKSVDVIPHQTRVIAVETRAGPDEKHPVPTARFTAGKTSSDDKVPPGPLNAMFEKIFGLERHVIGRMPFPAGVSLFALLSTR